MVKKYLIFQIMLLMLVGCSDQSTGSEPELNTETIVKRYGQLSVDGKNIINQNGEIVALRGMSLFWSQWGGDYYNKETVRWLRDDWKCTVVRTAIGIEHGGYLENKLTETAKLHQVIDACIDLGIYVIIDWHDHHAENHQEEAVAFFNNVSATYGAHPNIIYEIYNEPLDVSWDEVLMPYSEAVIAAIRKNDPDNIIVAGTPNWSQDVEKVIGNRIDDDNVVYSLHFYASTHRQGLRDKANQALAADIPLMVTEWGLSEASGTGEIDTMEAGLWFDFLEQNNLSWCNWSVMNKDETSAALLPSTTKISGWDISDLTQSGRMIRNYLISANGALFQKEE